MENKYSDELGELVDNINQMSLKIGQNEKMKTEFISSVSHELRTPLTAINGWGETILADPTHDPVQMRRGIRIIRLEQGYQMVSSGEMADFVTKALETRKPPKLSSSQLEALTIIAYYQPATKAMVEQIRGVDSSYSVAALLNKKLIEEAGRLNVPGRPIQYRTTPDFLRTFGLTSLEELPPIEKITFGEPIDEEAAAPQQEAQA